MCRCFFPQKIIRFAAGLFGRSEYFVFSFLGTGYIATRNIVLGFEGKISETNKRVGPNKVV